MITTLSSQAADLAAWQALIEALPQPAWLVALADHRVAAVNAAAERFLDRPRAGLVGEAAEQVASSPEDLGFWEAVAEGEPARLLSDTWIASPAGEAVPVTRSVQPLPCGEGAPAYALVTLTDRSAEQRADSARELLLAEQQATLECTEDGILVTDLAGRVRSFNRRFAALWSLPVSLLQQQDSAVAHWMARSVVDTDAYGKRLHALEQASLIVARDRIELQSGQVFDRVTQPLLVGGRLQGRVWCFRDQTERVAAQAHIDALTLHDALTGLANRRQLALRVAEASAAVRREADGGGSFALLLVDLDRFRQVNESLGHDLGDRVLLEVAQRLQATVGAGEVLARLGADQFALLLRPGAGDAAEAAEAGARRVLNVVAQPCLVDGAQLALSCSIGVALAPSRGVEADEMLRMAESALRAAKAGGRAGFRVHQARAEGDRQSRVRLDQAMRRALVSGRFRLHYQPQVSLAGNQVIGVEALLRWRDPGLGDVAPAQFLPVAEDTGFILAIGEWVLTQALRQAAAWQARGQPLPVSVNVSPLQFQQSGFVDGVAAALQAAGLPGTLLELELTEAVLAQDPEVALLKLEQLARLGVRLAIDDFGTGLSSVAQLARLPVGRIKIDLSFISGLPDDEADVTVVLALLQMARALGLQVVAEGVETEAQRQFLLDAGCDAYQGHLYAPALDPLTFQQRLPGAGALPPPPPPRRLPPHIRLVRG
ncbi:Diguanylate cyclase [Rubrivivax sp. A210]|uniref:putative bifunctional diguanylate cyclase/phosphodiesterase n=1 Tax=Rubrivivax sp. A210 TaxID=2772301 RepID=UPI00191AC5CC|nr:EAL domain-containing protein [Rubrivivax sp. A210]CAD5371827.1 Diguanylate cyclase [Rubrivivax sp. A210]